MAIFAVEARKSLVDRNYMGRLCYAQDVVEARKSLVDRNSTEDMQEKFEETSRLARASWIEIFATF